MDIKFFAFEAEHVQALRSVPMIVRFKLDHCGIKLPIKTWGGLGVGLRARLVVMPIGTPDEIARYRDFVRDAIEDIGHPVMTAEVEPMPLWMDARQLPEAVAVRARGLDLEDAARDCWHQLDELQRFTLVRLTRRGHETRHFGTALREFGVETACA